jgi:hypothetical protein
MSINIGLILKLLQTAPAVFDLVLRIIAAMKHSPAKTVVTQAALSHSFNMWSLTGDLTAFTKALQAILSRLSHL